MQNIQHEELLMVSGADQQVSPTFSDITTLAAGGEEDTSVITTRMLGEDASTWSPYPIEATTLMIGEEELPKQDDFFTCLAKGIEQFWSAFGRF